MNIWYSTDVWLKWNLERIGEKIIHECRSKARRNININFFSPLSLQNQTNEGFN
jgi:hypothetical protein